MEIGMVADIVLAKRRDHIMTSSLLEHPGLFTDDFECGANVTLAQHRRQPQTRIVVGRQ